MACCKVRGTPGVWAGDEALVDNKTMNSVHGSNRMGVITRRVKIYGRSNPLCAFRRKTIKIRFSRQEKNIATSGHNEL